MRKSGLLSRLISYAPREGRVAREDFFTEAFAHVMQVTPDLARHVLARMVEVEPSNDWHVSIETQCSYPIPGTSARCRPDIVVELSSEAGFEHVIFIESKIDAVAADGQLGNYAAVLKALPHHGVKNLVFLTRAPELVESADELGVKRWYWGQVRAWIVEWRRQHAHQRSVLVDELLTLMEELQMSLEISARELVSAVDYFGARRKLMQIIGASWQACPELAKRASGGKPKEEDAGLIATSDLFGPGVWVSYGFLLNMENPWQWEEFPSQLLPVAMVSLYVPETADSAAFRRDHKRAIDGLVGNGWRRYDDDKICIAGKLSRSMDLQQLDLTRAYERFLVEGLRQVSEAFR